MLITHEDAMRNWATTRCGLYEYIGCLVLVAQHMMQLEAVELAL
jgi:hypothetical protein